MNTMVLEKTIRLVTMRPYSTMIKSIYSCNACFLTTTLLFQILLMTIVTVQSQQNRTMARWANEKWSYVFDVCTMYNVARYCLIEQTRETRALCCTMLRIASQQCCAPFMKFSSCTHLNVSIFCCCPRRCRGQRESRTSESDS